MNSLEEFIHDVSLDNTNHLKVNALQNKSSNVVLY